MPSRCPQPSRQWNVWLRCAPWGLWLCGLLGNGPLVGGEPPGQTHAAVEAAVGDATTESQSAPSSASEASPEGGDQASRIASLIEQLASPDFGARETAREELSRLGTAAEEPLQAALGADALETRLAAGQLLQRLVVERLWEASPVRLTSESRSASQRLAELAAQTENRLLIGDQFGSFQDAVTTLPAGTSGFWPVLDEICRQSGNQVRPHYDNSRPGLVLVAGDAGKFPTAYAGPVRAQVTGARRQFVEELDYRQLRADQTHNFQLNLQFMWEDRFRVVAYRSQPEVLEAATETGHALTAIPAASGSWNVVGGGSRQMSVSLRLTPPPLAANKLATLRLGWGLIAVGDLRTWELTDLNPRAPQRQDDAELTLENVQQQASRCELTLLVVRDLVVPDPPEVLFHENDFELWDQQQRPYRLQGQRYSLAEGGARFGLSFGAPASDSTPMKLRVRYPRIRSQRELEIVFRDVPLPVGQPD